MDEWLKCGYRNSEEFGGTYQQAQTVVGSKKSHPDTICRA